jgi:hypothetical protein
MLTTLNEFEIEAGRGEARATSCQRMGDAVAPRACDPAAPRDAPRLARPKLRGGFGPFSFGYARQLQIAYLRPNAYDDNSVFHLRNRKCGPAINPLITRLAQRSACSR